MVLNICINFAPSFSLAEPTIEARAENQARLGYALQGGGRAEGSTARKGKRRGGHIHNDKGVSCALVSTC